MLPAPIHKTCGLKCAAVLLFVAAIWSKSEIKALFTAVMVMIAS